MARNLELKARCRSFNLARRSARSLGATMSGVLHQTDTYLDVPSGRLKLREIRGKRTELIFYDRSASASAQGRWSSYVVYPVVNGRNWLKALRGAWPVRTVVRKRRTLFLLANARIHLDEVQGLGDFVEFEVMMKQGRGQAERLYRRLRAAFGIRQADIIGGSYGDMVRPLRRRR